MRALLATALLATALLLGLTACHSQSAPEPAPAPEATPTSESTPSDVSTSIEFSRELLTGRLDPATDTGFVRLPNEVTDGDGGYLLRRRAAEALQRMVSAAAADGVTLRVVSAARNFDRQAQIWGAKWTGARTLSNGVNLATADLSDSAKARMILLYSSMPGTSRHHWGTDVDINELDNDYFASGQGAAEYAWLTANAGAYGFFQPYTSKDGGRTGYEEERWHWSYGPLSRRLLAAYVRQIGYDDIADFPGAGVAPDVRAIEEYVRGIEDPASN